jgi:AP-2 complex subunit mu-1
VPCAYCGSLLSDFAARVAEDQATAPRMQAVLILNGKGQLLISRIFRTVTLKVAAQFHSEVIIAGDDAKRSPIRTVGNHTFLYVQYDDLWLTVVTKSNVNAAEVFEFLNQITTVFVSHYGKFNEEWIRKHYVMIYQLLDGMDFPFSTRSTHPS